MIIIVRKSIIVIVIVAIVIMILIINLTPTDMVFGDRSLHVEFSEMQNVFEKGSRMVRDHGLGFKSTLGK